MHVSEGFRFRDCFWRPFPLFPTEPDGDKANYEKSPNEQINLAIFTAAKLIMLRSVSPSAPG